MIHKEFFTTRTVAEALAGFRPQRRTAPETVSLDEALHRVPIKEVRAPSALPGFARSTVDGYAVRAADTYGASEGLPSYLRVAGSVRMGAAAEVRVGPATAVAIPTGGVLPPGADAVVMVEYTQETMPSTIEVVRPVAPGDGLVRADEDAAVGAELVPAGRPLRAQDLGMLAAAGLIAVPVHRRPRVTLVSTGDELVPPDAAGLVTGEVRDALGPALAALVEGAGGEPRYAGIVRDDREALRATLAGALPDSDLLVVSAGSSVGARDESAAAIAALGEPGMWCHGLAFKPGKPTLLADAGGVPVVGLPGNPRSALVVFRLIGAPLVRLVGGCTDLPPEPVARAVLARDLPSAAGRLDVVQVRLEGDTAVPLYGSSSLLSVMTAADGYLVVPEAATGLAAGSDVEIVLYR